jgi:hypothetical protein
VTSREVHAIASANINAHFTHYVTDRSHITQVAETHGVKTSKNASLGANVAKIEQPFGEVFGLLELEHASIVSAWIRIVKSGPTPICSLTTKLTGACRGRRRAAAGHASD